MTKDEINNLFIAIDEENIENILIFITGELKNKMNQYSDKEEFWDEYENEILQNIVDTIPEDLYEYLIEKAKEYQIPEFINCIELDDERKIDLINKSEDVYFRMILTKTLQDESKKIKLLNEFDNVYDKLEIVKSIKDNNLKIKCLDIFESNSHKVEIIKTLSDEKKIEILDDKIKEEFWKAEIITSLEKDDKKIELMDKIADEALKTKVAISINDDSKKIESLQKIESSTYKVEVAKSIKSDEKKIAIINEFDDQNHKLEISKTINDDNKKIGFLDEFKQEYAKAELICSIKDDDKKIGFLNEISDISNKMKIINAISDIDNKIKALETIGYDKLKVMALKSILDVENKEDKSKYISDDSESHIIGLPKNMTIGVELETEGELSGIIINQNIINGWKAEHDGSISEGVEVISPILKDTEHDMQSLEIMCNILQTAGMETTHKCGGHIHIGADYLEGNPKAFENLTNIWYQCEELFYKMSNEKGNVPRDKITTYAKTMHSDLEEFASKDTINIHNISDFENMREKLVQKVPKYRGLNLGHYGEQGKNTIEFRIPNGTINPKTIKENIKLFGSLMQVSKEMALNPEFKKEEFKTVMNEKLTEGEKVEALLDLLFDDEKTKSIYRERWESVRDEKIFDELTEGQTQTFKRGDYSISSKQEIRDVATSEEAIEQMSGVSEEIKREVKEKQQQNQISNNTSIEDSTDAR